MPISEIPAVSVLYENNIFKIIVSNATDYATYSTLLTNALKQAGEEKSAACIVIACKETAFSTGAVQSGQFSTFITSQKQRQSLYSSITIPIILILEGNCLDVGLELLNEADLVLAVQSSCIGLSSPESLIFLPYLFDNLPRKLLLNMLYTGECISADVAIAHSLFNHVYSKEDLEKELEKTASRIKALPPSLLALEREAYKTMQPLSIEQRKQYSVSLLNKVLELSSSHSYERR